MSAIINHPFGNLATLAMSATGAQALTITNNFTYIDGVTTQATGNRTINLTIGSNVRVGAMILVASKSAATQTLTFGTGITSAVSTGVAGATITQLFVYTGAAFVAAGAQQQID